MHLNRYFLYCPVLQAVKSPECLEIMGKLLYNCAVSPREEKFRRIKLTNKRLAEVGVGLACVLADLCVGVWGFAGVVTQ